MKPTQDDKLTPEMFKRAGYLLETHLRSNPDAGRDANELLRLHQKFLAGVKEQVDAIRPPSMGNVTVTIIGEENPNGPEAGSEEAS